MQCLMIALMVLGLISAGGPGGGAWAQEPPELNLPQLIAMALKFSPEVKASKSEVWFATEQRNEVKGYYYPQFEAVGIGGVVPNARQPRVENGSLVYPDPATRLHGVNIFGRLDFNLFQPLYTFGKLSNRKEAAENNIKVKEAAVDAKKGEVFVRIPEAYYGLILANQGKDAVKEAKTYLSDIRHRVERALQIGSRTASESDLYRVNMYEGAIGKFAAEAEEGAKVAYAALKGLTGMGPGEEFRVPLELPAPAKPPETLDRHINQAFDLRPEFAQLKHGLKARELLVEAAKADRYPTLFLAVTGALAGAPGREQSRDPYAYDLFNAHYAFPVAGVKWNWDFGITKAKINQARAELQQLKHVQETAVMGIPIEVAQAYSKVQENYKKAISLEKSYVNARRWLITSLSNYDMGLTKLEDLFQGFEKYGAFRGDYLLSLYQYNFAVAQLDKATGAYRGKIGEYTEKAASTP